MEKAERKALTLKTVSQCRFWAFFFNYNAFSVPKRDYLGNKGEIRENNLIFKCIAALQQEFFIGCCLLYLTDSSWLSCIDLN